MQLVYPVAIVLYLGFFKVVVSESAKRTESKHNIRINKTYENCNKSDGVWACPSLLAAYTNLSRSVFSNCSISFLGSEVQHLNKRLNFTATSGLKFKSKSATVFQCEEHEETGMVFIDSDHITFEGKSFFFKNCGQKHLTDHGIGISSALLFQNTKNIHLENVDIWKPKGHGIYFTNCSSTVNLIGVKIEQNRLFSQGSDELYGGGIVFQNDNLSPSANLVLDGCQFLSLSAYGPNDTFKEEKQEPRQQIFGNGAGLSIILAGNDNVMNISSTKFHNSVALNGGGMYLLLGHGSRGNNIALYDTLFDGNEAKSSGGGIDIFSYEYVYQNHNNILLHNCNFSGNQAGRFGGGFSQRKPREFHQTMNDDSTEFLFKTKLVSCSFINNTGNLGSAVYLDDAYIMFSSKDTPTVIRSNTGFSLDKKPGGFATLFAYSSDILVLGELRCENNSRTAITLDYSSLHINGSMKLVGNTGYNGGAMSLYEESQIILYELGYITFKSNNASKGGAMYVQYEIKPIRIFNTDGYLNYRCFYTIHSNSNQGQRIIFINNNAARDQGIALFVTSLKFCDKIKIIQHLNLTENGGSKAINTYPKHLDYEKQDWKHIYPGRFLKPHIILTDELNNSVSDIVEIRILNISSVSIDRKYEQFLVVLNKIQLSFIGRSSGNKSFKLSVSTIRGIAKSINITATIQDCAFGHYFNTQSKKCECSQRSQISRCVKEDVYIHKNFWVDKNQTESIHPCPQFYCNCKSSKTSDGRIDCLYTPHKQCADGKNESSRLCSTCETGKAVGFGGNGCQPCFTGRYNIIWILPAMFVVIFFLVLVFIKVEIDIYRNYLNSTIFFYQIAPLFTFGLNVNVCGFLISLQSIIGLEGFHIQQSYGICLLENFTELDKTFFNYTIPGIAFFCIFAIYKLGQIFRIFNYQTTSYVSAAVFMIVWAYGDLVRVTFTLIKYSTISGVKYVFVEAEEEYFTTTRHCVYAAIAILVGILALALPCALIVSSRIASKIPKLKIFFDIYKSCFKEDTTSQLFPASFFVCRFVLFAIGTFVLTENPGAQQTVLACCLVTFYVVFLFVQPYKEEHMNLNYYDSVVLSLLAIVSVLTCAMYSLMPGDPIIPVYNGILNAVLIAPFLWVVFNFGKRLYYRCKRTRHPANEEGMYLSSFRSLKSRSFSK